MTKSETVTLLNDIVVMAPAAVLDLPFTWETLSDRTLRATFSNAGYTVSAELTFDAAGDLVGFISNDRSAGQRQGAHELPLVDADLRLRGSEWHSHRHQG